jgi:hypothetical protein
MDRIEELLNRDNPDQAARRELRSLQDDELKRVARSLGLRPLNALGSPRNWNIHSLRDGPMWCELCRRACESRQPGHSRGFPHGVGFSTLGGRGRLSAVLVHTRSPLAYVEDYARQMRLNSQLVGWSWMGTQFIAVLFSRMYQP